MELHQVRYFVALSDLLNFTAAADACNVSQPALSRAIAHLEAELGGPLFRRERKFTHLTDFGRAIQPVLRDCLDASRSVKAVARDYHRNGQARLHLALSRSLGIARLAPVLADLRRRFPQVGISLSRGTPDEITERLCRGEVDMAIAGPLTVDWSRIDSWPLFDERYGLLVARADPLATRAPLSVADLDGAKLLSCPGCPVAEEVRGLLAPDGARGPAGHKAGAFDDMPELVRAGFGLGVWPLANDPGPDLAVVEIEGHPLTRPVLVHVVCGRELSPPGLALLRLLRARDWTAAPCGAGAS